MAFEAVLHVIKNEMGLSPETIGQSTVERIIERRMKIVGEKNSSSYCHLLGRSAAEKQALFNEISVPETWFFRDYEPFKVLSSYIKGLEPEGRPLNILSIPCSSGEEPYSIAMVLNDIGLSKKQFRIDAVDISTEVIEKARKGVYGNNSFRGKGVVYREKYFDYEDGLYIISDDIKSTVNFSNANVLGDGFMHGKGPYDVVFCRNLLIYFDYETKCKALSTLHGLMGRKALLVLGHAETGRMPEGLFESLHLPGSFAYHKADVLASTPAKAAAVSSLPMSVVNKTNKLFKPVVAAAAGISSTDNVGLKKALSGERVVEDAPPTAEEIEAWINSIQTMANAGQLKEAITQCDSLIGIVPDSAQGYYLRGVILLAFDADSEAIDAFKNAVYLDPKNYQSLIHLAVLAEQQGDLRASENYRARAERLRKNAHVVVD